MSRPAELPRRVREWAARELGPLRGAERVYRIADRATWRLDGESGTGYLKLGPDLAGEAAALGRLRPDAFADAGLRVPRLIAYRAGGAAPLDALLTAAVPGADLTRRLDEPELVIRALADALRTLHGLDPVSVLAEGTSRRGGVVVHGDACLPNILVDPVSGAPSGLVDVGDLRVADPEVDIAAACWTLGFNLDLGWAVRFLALYGWPRRDEAAARELARRYEEGSSSS